MTIKTQKAIRAMLIIILASITIHSQAQDWKTEKKINLVFGLTQPLLVKGFRGIHLNTYLVRIIPNTNIK